MKNYFTQEIKGLSHGVPEKLVMMRLMQQDLGQHDHHFFELAYVTAGTSKHTLNSSTGILQAGAQFFHVGVLIAIFLLITAAHTAMNRFRDCI